MDLNNFIDKNKKKVEKNSKTILKNKLIEIKEDEENKYFKILKKDAFVNYEDELFFNMTNSIICEKPKEAKDFFKLSKKKLAEGIMLKNLSSNYKSGVRTGAMIKLKETKEDLDLVITGAEFGTGKRAGFLSSFFVSAKNEFEEFLEIGKVASGIIEKDENDEEDNKGISMSNLTNILLPLKISQEKEKNFFQTKNNNSSKISRNSVFKNL